MTPTPPTRTSWLELARSTASRRQFSSAGTTVVDQAAVSGGTFLLHVLLARFTSPTEYGLFVLAYSVIVLANELHNAVLLEPMMVFGSRMTGAGQRGYFASSLVVQLGFSGLLMFLVWLSCGVWYFSRGITHAVSVAAAMAIGLLGVQLREFTRKVFYTLLEPRGAFANDLVYLALLFSALGGARVAGRFGSEWAFLIIGFAGCLASTIGLARLGVRPRTAGLGGLVSANWRYGRWMIASAAARWSTGEMYYWVIAMFHGPSGAAALRAVQNLFAPASLFLTGLGNLLLPVASRFADTSPARRLTQLLLAVSVSLGILVLGYGIVATVASSWLFDLLYDGGYSTFAYLVPLLGVGHTLVAFLQGCTIGLRALNAPRAVFTVSMVSALVSLAVVFPLTIAWNLTGAALAWVLSLAIAVPFWLYYYRRAAQRVSNPSPAV